MKFARCRAAANGRRSSNLPWTPLPRRPLLGAAAQEVGPRAARPGQPPVLRRRRRRRDRSSSWPGRVAARSGRVAAILNHAHNSFHEERIGFFGFFECDRPGRRRQGLLEAAEGWAAERGLSVLRGPDEPVDQLRVRPAGRGFRPPAGPDDDLQPAVLRAAHRRRRATARSRTSTPTSRRSTAAARPAASGSPSAARRAHARADHAARPISRTSTARCAWSRRSTTRPGRGTGVSCR